jgi:hypothetical protein
MLIKNTDADASVFFYVCYKSTLIIDCITTHIIKSSNSPARVDFIEKDDCRSNRLFLERVMGIEPTRPAWEAEVLPLNYTRIYVYRYILTYLCKKINRKNQKATTKFVGLSMICNT